MPINTITIEKRCIDITGFTCDRCKKTYHLHRYSKNLDWEGDFEYQESWSHRFVGGYNSVIGDGNYLEVTLCQYCWYEILSPFAEIKERYI